LFLDVETLSFKSKDFGFANEKYISLRFDATYPLFVKDMCRETLDWGSFMFKALSAYMDMSILVLLT